MKLRSILFILMISAYLINAQEKNNNQQPLIVNVNVNTANRAHLDQQNSFNQQTDHRSTQTTHVTTDIHKHQSDLQQQFREFFQHRSQRAHDASTDMLVWISDHKMKTFGMSLLLLYGYIILQVYQANLVINDPASWSNWRHGTSLEDLFATPQHLLEDELLFAIQTKYVHPTNPTDFIYSIVQSSISLQKEMRIVQHQISRYQWLEQCRCLPLFFIENKDIEILKERHRKLLFMQHIFASWCARYKIDKN